MNSHKSPAPISQRQSLCFKFRNIGKLNTFHLIFAFQTQLPLTLSALIGALLESRLELVFSTIRGFSIRYEPIDAIGLLLYKHGI